MIISTLFESKSRNKTTRNLTEEMRCARDKVLISDDIPRGRTHGRTNDRNGGRPWIELRCLTGQEILRLDGCPAGLFRLLK